MKAALAQLPGQRSGTRRGRKILIRADGAGCTHEFLTLLAKMISRLQAIPAPG